MTNIMYYIWRNRKAFETEYCERWVIIELIKETGGEVKKKPLQLINWCKEEGKSHNHYSKRNDDYEIYDHVAKFYIIIMKNRINTLVETRMEKKIRVWKVKLMCILNHSEKYSWIH